MEVPGGNTASSVQSAMSTAVMRDAMNQKAGLVEELMEGVEEIQEAARENQAQSGNRTTIPARGNHVDFTV